VHGAKFWVGQSAHHFWREIRGGNPQVVAEFLQVIGGRERCHQTAFGVANENSMRVGPAGRRKP